MTLNLQKLYQVFLKKSIGWFPNCMLHNTNKSNSMQDNQISLSSNQLKLSPRSFLKHVFKEKKTSGTMR